MSELTDELFEAVRSGCSSRTWSRGVELARAGAVSAEHEAGGELVLRVVPRSGLVSPAVVLRPEAALWDCDCRSPEDPCEHVAAAVIALRQTRRRGESLAGRAVVGGRVGYRLRRAPAGLELERVAVVAEGEVPLRGTLAALASGRVDGPNLAATEADVEAERALGPSLRGVLPLGVLRGLLRHLARCPDVTLDGVGVRVDAEPLLPVVRVEDAPQGFRLRLETDAAVTERLAEGIVLCGDVIRPLAPSGLTGRELEEYGEGRVVPHGEATRLVAEILPTLAARARLDVRTQRLPRESQAPPRLRVEVEHEGDDGLSVLPLLVYGDPPCARVDAGRLVHLRGAVPRRDEAAERQLERRLRAALGATPGQRVAVHGEEALVLAERLHHLPGEIVGDAHAAFFRTAPLALRLEIRDDAFALAFEVPPESEKAGGRAVPGDRVLRAWREGASLVPLDGGGLAPLPADWLARHGERLVALLSARDAHGRIPPALLPDLAALCEDAGAPPPPGFERLRALVEGFEVLPSASLPDDLRAELRPYQRRGVDWLVFHREAGLGALLADDMGLGKTLQALCAIRGRTLVVCPTSVLVSWTEDLRRFRPGLHVCLYHGPARRLDPGADLTLTSWALLRGDAGTLAAEGWESVVLDEAQAIKNPDSQVARAAHGLTAPFRVILTGTPVENRLEELWSLFRFLEPGLLGPRSTFDDVARAVAAGDPGARERLRARLRPFLLRRTKTEVTPELPPRSEVVLTCDLGAEERAVYDAVRAATRREVVRLARGGSVLAALEALLRLRQAACHPGLVPGHESETSSKLELLMETLEQALAEGHRALVFSQWTALLDRLEPHLRRAGVAFLRLDGTTRDRAGVVRRFQAEDGPPVLLVSLRAGGSGLTLTAADHVFLLDPWWNPAVEDQAADRAHRIGQTRPVLVHRLVANGTVEERILGLQERKRALVAAALEGEGTVALTREDLLALLE